jgi:hypothetical protein
MAVHATSDLVAVAALKGTTKVAVVSAPLNQSSMLVERPSLYTVIVSHTTQSSELKSVLWCESVSMTEILIKHGADVNATNDGGASSLQVLGTDWDTTRYIIEDLLQLRANRKKIERGREQVGPLLYGALQEIAKDDIWTAVLIGDAGAMKKHLAAGFDANTSHPELNVAPLILAVIVGSPDAAQALIDHGAKLDARGDDGSTALHAAALFGRTAAAKVLLDSGASAKIMNFQGVTPLDNARVDWPTTQYIAQLLQIQLQEDAAVEGKKAIEAMLTAKAN